MSYDVRGCRRCGGCGVLTIADCYAMNVADEWISAWRCEQYVLCDRCDGLGLVVVRRIVDDAKLIEKAAEIAAEEPVEARLTEILARLPAAQTARILNGVRRMQVA